MAGKRKTNPAGSSNPLRGDVLRVLGVLKVATVDQIQRIALPHLTYRHTDKKTPSERKTARTASHLGALADLRKHGLTENGGRTKDGDVLRNLTAKGLEAASYELVRPVGEMGGTACGAGSSGASHPMAVNETVIAMLRPKPDLALLADEPADARAAAQAAVDAPDGIGTIASYATGVPLPTAGTWTTPGRGSAQADIVLTAPEAGVPLLFIEVDNCHETAQEIAAKIDKYMRLFQRKVKDTDGTERPMWRTRWPASEGRYGDVPHPPVLLVFNKVGARNPDNTVRQLAELARPHWEGQPKRGGYHLDDRKIPIVATGLRMLREHGPAGPVFLRLGRDRMEPLLEAIGNRRREDADVRVQEAERDPQEAYRAELKFLAEQKAADRDARRPICATCGAKFTDERWETTAASPKPGRRWYPTLCGECEDRAIEAGRQADQAERERHEQEEVQAEMRPLQALGLSATAEAAYLALVEQGPQTLSELGDRPTLAGAPVDGLQYAVTELSDIGLVSRTDDRLTAQPPRAALEAVAERRAREARIAHDSAALLSRFWLDHTSGSSYVEVVDTSHNSDAIQRRVHDEAVAEVRALWIGPVGGGDREPEIDTDALKAMARGIAYRVVYSATILQDPKALELAHECVDRGEQARVFPDLAMNLALCDNRFAVVSVTAPDRAGHHSVVVQPSGLLDALIGIFESHWRMAVPLPPAGEAVESGASPTSEARQLLSYLSAGLTDESIARELGVSERTVARRIARLQEVLGARTRFQLGVQASRCGWL
ncbi:replication-relaxation family protein [Microtetraspora malaysiensis]|uniref:Replication-relaxation family protein n=1 Tax=Microtetraspora malaysiensis TaxID=161358 RepID=A0ABW6T031_9ACTN